MTTAQATITENLTSAIRIETLDFHSFTFDIINTGANPLVDFKVKTYANARSPGVVRLDSNTEFSAPDSGSIVKQTEQRNSSDVRESVAPLSLPAGSSFSVTLSDNDGYFESLEIIEILAQVDTSLTTTLDIFVGRA